MLSQLINRMARNQKDLNLFPTMRITHLAQLVLQSLEIDPSYEFIKENEQFKQIIGELTALL